MPRAVINVQHVMSQAVSPVILMPLGLYQAPLAIVIMGIMMMDRILHVLYAITLVRPVQHRLRVLPVSHYYLGSLMLVIYSVLASLNITKVPHL